MTKTPDSIASSMEPVPEYRGAWVTAGGTIDGTPFAVQLRFQDADRVYVTWGHVREDGGPIVRGMPFAGSFHLAYYGGAVGWSLPLDDDKRYTAAGNRTVYLSRTDVWGDPSPAVRKWVIDRLAPHIGAFIESGVVEHAAVLAAYRNAAQTVEDATKERDAAHELAALRDSELAAAREAQHAASEALARFEHRR